jgi:hypothetical protein
MDNSRSASRSPNPYSVELDRLSPIIPRLDELGIGPLTTTTHALPYFNRSHQLQHYRHRIVDLNKLRTAGPVISNWGKIGTVLGKVFGVEGLPESGASFSRYPKSGGASRSP